MPSQICKDKSYMILLICGILKKKNSSQIQKTEIGIIAKMPEVGTWAVSEMNEVGQKVQISSLKINVMRT